MGRNARYRFRGLVADRQRSRGESERFGSRSRRLIRHRPLDAHHKRELADIDLVAVLQLGDIQRLTVDSDLWRGAQVPQSHPLRSEQNIAVDGWNQGVPRIRSQSIEEPIRNTGPVTRRIRWRARPTVIKSSTRGISGKLYGQRGVCRLWMKFRAHINRFAYILARENCRVPEVDVGATDTPTIETRPHGPPQCCSASRECKIETTLAWPRPMTGRRDGRSL